MSGTYTVVGEPFDALGIVIDQAKALLHALDRAELFDKISPKPEEHEDYAAISSLLRLITEKVNEADDLYDGACSTGVHAALREIGEPA